MSLLIAHPAWAAPLPISTQAELKTIGTTGDYIITDSINLDNSFTSSISEFKGTLDGNNKTITMSVQRFPLFNLLDGATVKNLIIDANVNSGNNTGALAAEAKNSTITNIVVEGTVSGGSVVGGVVGSADSGTVLSNVNIENLAVSGGDKVGGVVGVNAGQINTVNTNTSTEVFGNNQVGGVAGVNSGSISNAEFDGKIIGRENVGGIVGLNSPGGEVKYSSFSSSAQIANGGFDYVYKNIGGIVGSNYGDISEVYVFGKVIGIENVGGVAGLNSSTGVISDSTMSGKVSGDPIGPNKDVYLYLGVQMGGIAGINSGLVTATRVNSSASIEGTTVVGGLAGFNSESGIIRNSSNRGNVNAIYNAGGAAGVNDTSATIRNVQVRSSINASFPIGGIVGTNRGAIYDSSLNGTVTGDQYLGGLVGLNEGLIANSSVSEDSRIVGFGNAGGAVGSNSSEGLVFNVRIGGEISSARVASGVIGFNFGTVLLSKFTGNVYGEIIDGSSIGAQMSDSANVSVQMTNLLKEIETNKSTPLNSIGFRGEFLSSSNEIFSFRDLNSLENEVQLLNLKQNMFGKASLNLGETFQLKIEALTNKTYALWIILESGKIVKLGELLFNEGTEVIFPPITLVGEDDVKLVWGESVEPVIDEAGEIISLAIGSDSGILSLEILDN